MRRDSGAQYLFINSKFNTNSISRLQSTSVGFIFTMMDFCYFYFLAFMVIRMLNRKYQ
jgi:bacteriorhodopsin